MAPGVRPTQDHGQADDAGAKLAMPEPLDGDDDRPGRNQGSLQRILHVNQRVAHDMAQIRHPEKIERPPGLPDHAEDAELDREGLRVIHQLIDPRWTAPDLVGPGGRNHDDDHRSQRQCERARRQPEELMHAR